MKTMPLSIRFDPAVLDRLRRTARHRTASPSGLAMRLVDEGLRSLEFDGIVFREGQSGRRAAIAGGPDVWEIVAALQECITDKSTAITQTAGDFSVLPEQVRVALAYYGSYPTEIDQQISDNLISADAALESWLSQQRVFHA